MKIATMDFESFWDTDYSLAKMSPLEYVMGDRFEAQLLSIKFDDGKTDVYFGPQIDKALASYDWSKYAICGHNMSGFDSYILAYRYGVRPRLWMCTLAMARPIHAKTVGLGLAKLVEHYGLGVKDSSTLLQTKGRLLRDFTPQERIDMAKYCRADTDQTRLLFKRLMSSYTAAELWQIDAVVRMRTEPQFELDIALLTEAARVERNRKREALADLAEMLGSETAGFDSEDELLEDIRSQLASASKFSEILEQLGVAVPMKASPTNPEKQIPALAKSDEEFIALQDHPNPLVAAAALARLDVKSTLLETRIQKFLTAGSLAEGKLPIPIRYCGADTSGRDSGEEYNPQNLPRIAKGTPKPSDALRMSLRAPPGYVVIVADQAGIELRVNHFLWMVPFTMQVFAKDPAADLYREAGARMLGIPAAKLTKPQRQMQKIKELGLGFGAGPVTFQRIAKGMNLNLTASEAYTAVEGWRSANAAIVSGWKNCACMLARIEQGRSVEVDPWGLVKTNAEGFVLPSGRVIRYPDLRYLEEDDVIQEFFGGVRPNLSKEQYESQVINRVGWWYARGRHRARLTGPKADENIVQALARDTVFDCALQFYQATGLYPALRVHDELIYVVPEDDAEVRLHQLQQIMRTPPVWWPQLIVWSEGDIAPTYGEAK